MRLLLAAMLTMSCVADEPEQVPAYIQKTPPPVPQPAFDANGCLTQEQMAQLSAELEEIRIWQIRAQRALEENRCYPH